MFYQADTHGAATLEELAAGHGIVKVAATVGVGSGTVQRVKAATTMA